MSNRFLSLAFVLLTFFLCILIGNGIIYFLVDMEGAGLELSAYSKGRIRLLIFILQAFNFLIPSLISLYYLKRLSSNFSGFQSVGRKSLLSIFWYIGSLGFISYMVYINQLLPMPDFLPFERATVPDFLLKILEDMSISELLLNFLIIAILPAIGEELTFRALLIPFCERLTKNSWLAILLSAFIFAVFHFEFDGLIARFLLGIILAILYLQTRTIWWPFLIHAIHNGSQVLLAYFYPKSLLQEDIYQPPIWLALCSLFLFLGGAYYFTQQKKNV